MKIENVNAVITGGGSGLGEGTARLLKEKGANVFLIDINEEGLKKVSSDLDSEYFVGDVSNPDLMNEAIKDIVNINCLVIIFYNILKTINCSSPLLCFYIISSYVHFFCGQHINY